MCTEMISLRLADVAETEAVPHGNYIYTHTCVCVSVAAPFVVGRKFSWIGDQLENVLNPRQLNQ